jgi:hypothetical protein
MGQARAHHFEEERMSIEKQVVQVTSYELTGSAEAFTRAISALSARTQAEGPRGILRYSFYVNADNATAGAIIIYRDSEAWLGQHDFVSGLDEYQDFYKTIRLVGLRFFGDLSPAMRQWLDERNLQYEDAGQLVAGFQR